MENKSIEVEISNSVWTINFWTDEEMESNIAEWYKKEHTIGNAGCIPSMKTIYVIHTLAKEQQFNEWNGKEKNVEVVRELIVHEITHAFMSEFDNTKNSGCDYNEEFIATFISKRAEEIVILTDKVYQFYIINIMSV